MKKFLEYGMMAVLSVLALAACTDSDSYTEAGPEGNKVYFPLSLSNNIELDRNATSFDVTLQRVKSDYDVTVPLTLNDPSGKFSIPSSVTLANGQSETTFKVSYDPAKFEYEETQELTIAIGDENLQTPYGRTAYKVSTLFPAPLTYLGTGTLIDNFWFENGDEPEEVEIYQSQLNPNEFRIMNPFAMCEQYSACDGTQSPYMTITIMQPGQTLRDQDITQTGLVYFSDTSTGYHHSSYDQTVWIYHPSAFSSLGKESDWVYNRVTDWQENGLPGRIQLAPFYYMDGVGGWNNTTYNEVLLIDFPGFVPKDVSVEFSYNGVLTAPDGSFFAQGYLNLGEDATNVKAVVVDAEADPEAVADAVAAGDVETAIDVTAGLINVPIPEGLTGNLLVEVVVIDGDKAKNFDGAYFEFYGGGASPWKSIGTGYLSDNFVISAYYMDEDKNTFPPQVYEVEIFENSDMPGLYRVANAFYGAAVALYEVYGEGAVGYTPADLEVNATDPSGVYILPQSTGVDDGDGLISIATMGGYYISRGNDVATVKDYGYLGMLNNGVIRFPKFVYKDSETGEEMFNYQGVMSQGSDMWYAGTTGEFAIVLPSAVQSVKDNLRAKAKATKKRAHIQSRIKRVEAKAYDAKQFFIKDNGDFIR